MKDEQRENLTYGELMMLCEGHGTSKIYERHLESLAARERAVWEEARIGQAMWQNNRGDFYGHYHADTFDDWCRQQAKKEAQP